MAGLLLLIMGFTGLGTAVKYIPRPVTIGFTNGIALLIASTQIKDFLGLTTPPVPSEFLPRIEMLLRYAGTLRGKRSLSQLQLSPLFSSGHASLDAFPAPSLRWCSQRLLRLSSICL